MDEAFYPAGMGAQYPPPLNPLEPRDTLARTEDVLQINRPAPPHPLLLEMDTQLRHTAVSSAIAFDQPHCLVGQQRLKVRERVSGRLQFP